MKFSKVFKKEFAATFRLLPLITSGVITPLLIYWVFGIYVGQNTPPVDGIPYKQFVVIGTVLFQLVYAVFFQASYSTFFSANVTQTLDELLASPLDSYEIVLGRMLNSVVIALMVSVPVLLILMAISQVPFHLLNFLVNVIYLFLIATFFSLLGTLIAVLVDSEFTLISIANVVIIPLVFMSDTFVMLSKHSDLVNYLLYLSPLRLANEGMRNILLKSNFNIILLSGLILYTAAMFIITTIVFERKSKE